MQVEIVIVWKYTVEQWIACMRPHRTICLEAKGIPMGIQVAANEMNDRLCLAVAGELELAFGGWLPPYNININN
uniref:Amidase domain-containing protein n=1 Tax=Glossina morsitans morsitans TaxID=37546 RepID=A0A1B0GED5_GLOMM